MPTQAEIFGKADEIDKDAEVLHEAVLVLIKHGASGRVIKEVRTRRDEWQEQASEMRRRAGGEGGQI